VKVLSTRLQGLLLVEPATYRDDRGFFLETFREDAYADIGIDTRFLQDNHSRSAAGVIRAFHFQMSPGQPKLVRVAHGAVYDVVVDIRRDSDTFGQWESFELDDDRNLQLYVPVGFAHGFCCLTETVDFVYKVGSYYDPLTETGIAWDDPDLAVPWPATRPLVSDRDRTNPQLREIVESLPAW
jgi:dTDP-4-dehydrorhamnose 3,5-epimerase